MDLIERLEKASGPDRALDNDIWALLDQPLPDDPVDCPLHYTASIDAALTVIPAGWWPDIELLPGANPTVTLWNKGSRFYASPEFSVDNCNLDGDWLGASAPIAICIAAIKARVANTRA